MKSKIPLFNITDITNDIEIDWHSGDYYISGDKNILTPKYLDPYIPTFYGLIIGIEGWVDFRINDVVVRIEKNTFFSHGPNIIAQRVGHSPNAKIRAVLFSKSFLSNNFNNSFLIESFHHFSTHFKNCVTLNDCDVMKIEDIYKVLLIRRREADTLFHIEVIRNLIISYVFEFALIVGKLNGGVISGYTHNKSLFYNFKNLVFEYCLKEKKLQFYADSLAISSKHLIKIIKELTGETPGYFINEAIITLAKVHLKNETLTISEVATSFPFSDLQTFGKFFKRHTGMSPLQYRNQLTM